MVYANKKIKDHMLDKVQIGMKGHVTIDFRDTITDKVVERIEKDNTISEWIAKIHEGAIRAQAYQGNMATITDWFRTIVLASTPLNIHYNTKNINIYQLDANGTYLKDFDNHPLIVGYCKNLTTSLADSSKSGIYDINASNLGRKINSTRRVFVFPASKANGTINSIFFTGAIDPFIDSGVLYNYTNISLPSNINNLTSQVAYKIIGKLNNNNYVVAALTVTKILYEMNPNTGEILSSTTLSASASTNNLALINNIIYYKYNEITTTGEIIIKKATWGIGTFDNGTNISITKPLGNWFNGLSLISDGSYLYSIHVNNSNNFFFARITPTFDNIIYYEYLTNVVNLQFSYWSIDPIDNSIGIGYDPDISTSQIVRYKVIPSNPNEYLNLYGNSEQFRYSFDSISGNLGANLYCSVFKYNNKYYSPNGQLEVFGNNFGSLVNLDTPVSKTNAYSMTVTYDYTIL